MIHKTQERNATKKWRWVAYSEFGNKVARSKYTYKTKESAERGYCRWKEWETDKPEWKRY